MTNAQYLDELRRRLKNPAIEDQELLDTITAVQRDISVTLYSPAEYDAQVLDSACWRLMIDKKFPEVGSISANGESISFSHGGIERLESIINSRRWAAMRNKFA